VPPWIACKMSVNEGLMSRLADAEDNFVERKAGVKGEELRRTIVAFANSVPEGREGVVFIGVRDGGEIQGIDGTDSLQKTVESICSRDCYPPVRHRCEVLRLNGKEVLAVVIPSSSNRPHFSGPAFVRRGSQTIGASEDVFNDLIASRSSKPAAILRYKGQQVTVVAKGKELGSTKALGDPRYRARHDCRVEECSAHTVRLFDLATNNRVAEPLENVKVSFDEEWNRLLLVVQEP